MNNKQTNVNLEQIILDLPEQLHENVRLLGKFLGDAIRTQSGKGLFERVEKVRQLAIDARNQQTNDHHALQAELTGLSADEMYDLARAFNLFLNLSNIADQHHQLVTYDSSESSQNKSRSGKSAFCDLDQKFNDILKAGISPEKLFETVNTLSIEPVLTAHPTEVSRRTVANKYLRISALLVQQDQAEPNSSTLKMIHDDLYRVITELWETDEIRRHSPTPLDEAKSGLLILEQTLWDALPKVVRRLSNRLEQKTTTALPLASTPLKFCSWMGGDRDGNPNVTSIITEQVIWVSRWKVTELYFREIKKLRNELSMNRCNKDLRDLTNDAHEPYREILKILLTKLTLTLRYLEAKLDGKSPSQSNLIEVRNDLLEPLLLCYQSLVDCNNHLIAKGRLSDILRRVYAFGIIGMAIDIRQEAARHEQAISELCDYLDLGDYANWPEDKRQTFLNHELTTNRPLIPKNFPASDETQEVLETFALLARLPSEYLGAYIISMASQPSDVLAVEVLQKASGNLNPQRVVPLFERLDDLIIAPETMQNLWSNKVYQEKIKGSQEIMIGYSDSAKDAGQMSAAWGLYKAQEKLAALAHKHDIKLTLFHGRGGSVARGGGPAHSAIRAQPPGSVMGSIRVTEQGEVIQSKYGVQGLAEENLKIYLCAVLDATLTPPPLPKKAWRKQMDTLSAQALKQFRSVIREDSNFVPYFIQATPEAELGNLKIGSRPARRRSGQGITHLRAIPWIFAWTQTRLMLPAWLGFGSALEQELKNNKQALLREMQQDWPFFDATVDLIEMVLAKADPNISRLYDLRLVDHELQELGNSLRDKYQSIVDSILALTKHKRLVEHEPFVLQGIIVRNPYVDPLNILQIEILERIRKGETGKIHDAMAIVINGISAGMRNTG